MPKIKNLFLNHVYNMIDEHTYNAIKNSEFLKEEFCNIQEQSKHNDKMAWTGIYLTGENTYFEFFNEIDKQKLQSMGCGDIGIAFSIDEYKEYEKLIDILKQNFKNDLYHTLFDRDINGKLVKWFYYVMPINNASTLPELDTWVMNYHQDYFKDKYINEPDKNYITRKEYNQNCNTVTYDKNKLFKDIEEITLLLNKDKKRKFVELLNLYGFICVKNEDYDIYHGAGITFKIQESKDKTCKLLKLQMFLNINIDKFKSYKIGKTTLELENNKAIWSFE